VSDGQMCDQGASGAVDKDPQAARRAAALAFEQEMRDLDAEETDAFVANGQELDLREIVSFLRRQGYVCLVGSTVLGVRATLGFRVQATLRQRGDGIVLEADIPARDASPGSDRRREFREETRIVVAGRTWGRLQRGLELVAARAQEAGLDLGFPNAPREPGRWSDLRPALAALRPYARGHRGLLSLPALAGSVVDIELGDPDRPGMATVGLRPCVSHGAEDPAGLGFATISVLGSDGVAVTRRSGELRDVAELLAFVDMAWRKAGAPSPQRSEADTVPRNLHEVAARMRLRAPILGTGGLAKVASRMGSSGPSDPRDPVPGDFVYEDGAELSTYVLTVREPDGSWQALSARDGQKTLLEPFDRSTRIWYIAVPDPEAAVAVRETFDGPRRLCGPASAGSRPQEV